MREEYTERSGRGLINFLLVIVVIGIVVALVWKLGAFDIKENAEELPIEQTNIKEPQSSTQFTITEQEWNAIQAELKQLQNEVAQLRKELTKKTTAAPAKTTTQTTTKPAAATTKPVATTAKGTTKATTAKANTADITLESYSHDLYGSTARLSFKNNTNDEVTSITGRMIYYDMSGNMLDYRDFTKSTAIDPGMVKSVDIEGFRTSDDYVYYKNKYADLGVKYKVKFQLKSDKTR